MKRVKKALLVVLLPPILVIGVLMGYLKIGQSRVNDAFTPANTLVWQSGGVRNTVRTREHREGDLQTYTIEVLDANADILHRTVYQIDWDLFGAGFVRGFQVDADPEIELAMVKRGLPEVNLYLDPVAGGVVERPFENASPKAKAIAERWFDFNATSTMLAGVTLLMVVVWILGTGGYYLVLVPIIRFVKNRMSPDSTT